MATVILVRHGRTTANASGVLAGRTAGVRLDDDRRRPGGADRASGSPSCRWSRSSPARSSGAGRPRGPSLGRQAAVAAGDRDRARHHRVRLRRVAGPAAQGPGQGAALEDRADPAVGGDLPGRRVDGDDAGPRRWPPYAGATRSSRPSTAPARSGWRSATATSSSRCWPTRSACTSTSSSGIHVDPASVSIVRYTATRPYVLATNTHAGDLSWLAPPPAEEGRRAPAARPRTPRSAAARAGCRSHRPRVVGMPADPRIRPAGALRHRHRRPARAAHLLPAGPRRRPDRQRLAGEAAGRGARPSGSTSCSTR